METQQAPLPEQTPDQKKQSLRDAHTESIRMGNEATSEVVALKEKGKQNTFFAVLFGLVTFIYPMFYMNFTQCITYVLMWICAITIIAIRISLFTKIIQKEILVIGCKNVETFAENELETIRRQEYDKFTREVNAKRIGNEIPESVQSSSGDRAGTGEIKD